jgi:hypothetical protein
MRLGSPNMHRQLISVFVLFLLTVAGSAFALAPPFTISFSQAQYSALENEHPSVLLIHSGTVPGDTNIQLRITEMPYGGTQVINFPWGTSGDTRVISVGQDDPYYNPGRSFVVTILSVGNGGGIAAPGTATMTIIDNEVPPTVSINDVTIVEGTSLHPDILSVNFATFTISLASAFPFPVSVPVAFHDQSAKNGVDFLAPTTAVVVFGFQQQTATLFVPIVGDKLPEGDKTFTVELLPQSPVLPGRTIATCTILDDDGAVSPLNQRIAEGGDKGVINIRLTDPAAADEQVILQASDPTLLTVPGSVTIPAGASEAMAEFTGARVGAGSIFVTLPPTRGGRTYELSVTVHDATTLTIDPIRLDLNLGAEGTATARVDPVPAAPVRLLLQPAKTGVVSVPDTVLTGADGKAFIPVRAIGLGSTIVGLSLLDINGGASLDLGVGVTLGPGPVATSINQALGRSSGGQWVTISGFNFSDRCAFSLGGVPAPETLVQPNGTVFLLTPPHDAGTVDLAVRCGTRPFVLASAITYQPSPVKLTGVSPKTGTTHGGTLVAINGADLRFDSCGARFGETQASLISTHGTTSSITAVAPSHEAGSVAVTLVCGSETVTLPNAFNYVAADDPPATVSNTFGLQQGAFAGIDGVSFRRDDQILINGVALPDVSTPESSRHLYTLPEIAGQAELTLRDYAGRTLIRTVTISPPVAPAITTIPDRITLGAKFPVTGRGLRSGLTYMLGPAPVEPIPNPLISSFDRSLCNVSCTPPDVFRAPISVGPGTVSFTIADHGTVLATKSVQVTTAGPVVSTITPPCAAFDGGSLVTIFGNGFEDGAVVQFGTTRSMEVVVKDPFTMTVKLPPAFGITQPQITVFNPSGTSATLTNAFRYASEADCGSGRRRAAGR